MEETMGLYGIFFIMSFDEFIDSILEFFFFYFEGLFLELFDESRFDLPFVGDQAARQ